MNPAARGTAVIDRYRTKYGALDDLEVSAVDLVADLQVWAVANDLDWDKVLGRAERFAKDELHCCTCGRTDPAALNDDLLCSNCVTGPDGTFATPGRTVRSPLTQSDGTSS
ncbi:hypothetical protein ABZ851_30370 [Streptomyces sp. NPDC047049]|uniref:hypothetical protein n=1 Tax=Streptomyces sp. NPDC047049 TaxID=3156688 RepID=UPI0033DD8109